jgi:hypothetical protein
MPVPGMIPFLGILYFSRIHVQLPGYPNTRALHNPRASRVTGQLVAFLKPFVEIDVEIKKPALFRGQVFATELKKFD